MTFINPAGVQLLGYESAAELIGRSPHTTFHHTTRTARAYRIEDCPLAKVRITGKAIHADEDGFWRKDGSAMPGVLLLRARATARRGGQRRRVS